MEILGEIFGIFPGRIHEEICKVIPRGISELISGMNYGGILEKIPGDILRKFPGGNPNLRRKCGCSGIYGEIARTFFVEIRGGISGKISERIPSKMTNGENPTVINEEICKEVSGEIFEEISGKNSGGIIR